MPATRLWDGHDYGLRDNLSWLKGTHLFQFGGEYMYDWWHFDRYDNVVGGLTQLVEAESSSGINFDRAYLPMACSDSVTGNCLPTSHDRLLEESVCPGVGAGQFDQCSGLAHRREPDRQSDRLTRLDPFCTIPATASSSTIRGRSSLT